MLVHQDAALLGEAERRIFESGEDHGPLVNRQGEQRDAVIERLLEPLRQFVRVEAALTIAVSSAVAAASTGIPASITGRA